MDNIFHGGGKALNARVSCLRHCDERVCVHKCVNTGKSQFQALESSPVVCPVMSPHLLF